MSSNTREYGRANLSFIEIDSKLMHGVPKDSQVWMSHGDTIATIPSNYKVLASTNDIKVAAFKGDQEKTYGLRFI